MSRPPLLAGLVALLITWDAAPAAAPDAKPQAPATPPSLVTDRTSEDCADPDRRAAIVADMKKEIPSFLQYPGMAGTYSTALMDWKSEQLRRAGWTKEDETKLGRDILTNAQFKAELEKGVAELEGLFDVLPTLDEKDEQAMCKGAFALQARFDGLVRHTMAQWKIIDDAMEAEARRLGTSFE